MTQEFPELSPYDSDQAIEEANDSYIDLLLDQYNSYIAEQVENQVGHYLKTGYTPVMDKDDIAQLVLIKFWLSAKKKHIDHPKAYIRRMIHNEFVTMLRGCKPILPLSLLEEEEETRDAGTMLIPCEEKDLPEFQVEHEDTATCCAAQAAKAIAALAPRQKNAMECTLYEHLDDPMQYKDTFELCNLHIEDARWPTREAEKKLLNASLFAARANVAQVMNIDLKLYKQKGASYVAV